MKTLKTIVAAPFMLIGFVLMTLGALVMYVLDLIGVSGPDNLCEECDCPRCAFFEYLGEDPNPVREK
jgi:hypothetical protein